MRGGGEMLFFQGKDVHNNVPNMGWLNVYKLEYGRELLGAGVICGGLVCQPAGVLFGYYQVGEKVALLPFCYQLPRSPMTSMIPHSLSAAAIQ